MITKELLEQANKGLEAIPVKGKSYVMVNKRVEAFRAICPDGAITTDIITNEGGVVVMKATVMDETGKVLSTGLSYEKEGNSTINKTSYIENAETSAVGRCLGMLGIGIDTSVASYEEVANAQANQGKKTPKNEKPKTYREQLREWCSENFIEQKTIIQMCGLSEDSTEQDFKDALMWAIKNWGQ